MGRLSARPAAKPASRPRADWSSLYDWQTIDRTSDTPVVHQIYLQIRSAILTRRLQPGTRLPSSRALATRLQVARSSVIEACEQLHAEGYLMSRIGSGTFVSSDLPATIERPRRADARQAAPVIDKARRIDAILDNPTPCETRPFNTGRTTLDPRTREVWRRLSHHAVRTLGADDLGYSDPRGLPEFREAVSDYLRAARAVDCTADQILITAGTQHAIDIIIRVLLRPDDKVWVEDPGYPLTRQALAMAGIRTQPVPVDQHGLRVADGTTLAPRARAAFVTPSHQYPTGRVMAMPRRIELLSWARSQQSWIIEDDYASEFRYAGRPLSSLQGLDRDGRVIYVGTLNKALFPGLRLGYAVLPQALVDRFVTMRTVIDRQPPSLQQSIAAAFMRDGHFAAHIHRTRVRFRSQRDALVHALARHCANELALDIPEQGMHLVADFRDGRSDTAVERLARADGIIVRAISPLYAGAPKRSGLILGFSGYEPRAIETATARLGAILRRADKPGARRR